MIIRDENGKVVGSVEFSKEEMEAFSNEELFHSYAKNCLENLVRLHEINKNSEVKMNETNKQAEATINETNKRTEATINEKNKQTELAINEKNKQTELAINEKNKQTELAIEDGKRRSEEKINERNKQSDDLIVEGKRKSEDTIRIINAVIETVRYGIGEFTSMYERLHSQKPEQPSNNDDPEKITGDYQDAVIEAEEQDFRNFKTSVI